MIQFLFSRYEIKECLYAFFDCDRHKFILLMSRIQVPGNVYCGGKSVDSSQSGIANGISKV